MHCMPAIHAHNAAIGAVLCKGEGDVCKGEGDVCKGRVMCARGRVMCARGG